MAQFMTNVGAHLCTQILIAIWLLYPHYSHAETDPTQPPATLLKTESKNTAETPASFEPSLQAILLSSERKRATINGQSMQEGDTINEATLVKINTDHVLLRMADKSIRTLKLHTLSKQTTKRTGNELHK